ncbi:MAG: hypothetical protein HQM04_16725 [Magnetococcales bacterium]|nr:hypothetical protein [Magnetococcales bacterium]MBF0116675.1 hypothetical protein [Magnetococcales bacterium]
MVKLSQFIFLFFQIAKPSQSKARLLYRSLLAIGFFLCGIGMKYFIIEQYGNATPFWDQWNAEWSELYQPYLNHTLSLVHLISPHNEHRIVLTRIFALTILKINGLWDPLLQMTLNAILHVFSMLLLLVMMMRKEIDFLSLLFTLSLLLLVVNFGFENTLWGFQSQFYFLLLCSFMAIWLWSGCAAWTVSWWVGVFMATLSYFSFASGVVTVAAGAGLFLLRAIVEGVPQKRSLLLAVLFLLLLLAGMLLAIPQLPHHLSLHAASWQTFFTVFFHILAWPYADYPSVALWINLPWWIVFVYQLTCSRRSDAAWLVIALGIWQLGQTASIAYGRNIGFLAFRYLDIYQINLIINLAALGVLASWLRGHLSKIKIHAIGLLWLFPIMVGVVDSAMEKLPIELSHKKSMGQLYERSVHTYLQTGNVDCLRLQPVPYPSWEQLRKLLDLPGLSTILASNNGTNAPFATEDASHKESVSGGRLLPLRQFLLRYALEMLFVGSLSILLAVAVLLYVKRALLRDALVGSST